MKKIIKVLIPIIIIAVFITIMLNRCQKESFNNLNDELKTTADIIEETTEEYIENSIESKEIKQDNIAPIIRMEELKINEINRDDYNIIEFNDEKEKNLYNGYALWINKNSSKQYKQGRYEKIIHPTGDMIGHEGEVFSEDYYIVEMNEYEIEEYNEKHNIIEKIGLEQAFNDYVDIDNLVLDLCKKNCNFSNRFVTDAFKNKYNEIDGILGEIKFDSIEFYDGDSDDLYKKYDTTSEGSSGLIPFLLTLDNKRTRVAIIPNTKYDMLDNVEILDIRDLTNEKGEPVKLKMDEYNWLNCIERLAFQDDDEVGKSERFIEEHPDFQGIFPNDLKHRNVNGSLKAYEVSFNNVNYNKMAVEVWIYNKAMLKSNKYLLSVTKDENECIDTFDLQHTNIFREDDKPKIEQVNYIINDYTITKLIDKNRDWSDLMLSKRFLENFDNKKGILDNTNIMSWNRTVTIKKINENNKMPLYIIDDNMQKHFYGLTFKIVDNLIDDVEVKKLDITEFPKGDEAFDLF